MGRKYKFFSHEIMGKIKILIPDFAISPQILLYLRCEQSD
jgi:hypothetical protein